jgi:hypothetical protein
VTRKQFILVGLAGSIAARRAAAQQKPAQPLDPKSPAAAARLAAVLQSDPLLRAMHEEVSRAKSLRALGQEPYYIEVVVDDAESLSVSAILGSAFAPTRSRLRPVRTQIRVGSPQFDNTNSIFSDYYSGSRFDSGRLPLDSDLAALRHAMWLSLDRAYKGAVEAIGRKQAAVKGVTSSENLPDFWPDEGKILLDDLRPSRLDEEAWRARVKALSAVFLAHPDITSSSVEYQLSTGTTYLVNTSGSYVRVPDQVAMLSVRASRQTADGATIYDGLCHAALDPAGFPAETEIRRSVEDVARNVTVLAAAPVGESYAGPVLFDGVAAAQIFGEVFGSHLGIVRRPVSEPGRNLPAPVSEFDGRIGSRVLPDWMELVDDPTLTEYRKRPLAGHYRADLEGVFPAPLQLVEKGVLKALVTTRQPVKGMPGSNGRARLYGGLGVKTARISNLFVRAARTEPAAQLKSRLIDMIKQQGKPFGMIVRKMDFPSSGAIEELRRIMARGGRSGGGRPVSTPVLAYRVYPDGREELVRGMNFRSLSTRSFRDIVAAGDQEHQFNYIDNGAPLALMGAGNYIVACSVISPSLLFEELELEPGNEDRPKPPVVPPPPFGE